MDLKKEILRQLAENGFFEVADIAKRLHVTKNNYNSSSINAAKRRRVSNWEISNSGNTLLISG